MIKNFEIRAPDIKNMVGDVAGIEKQSPSILSRAINRAAITAKTSISRSETGIPRIYRIKSSEIQPATKISKTADKGNLMAVVSVKGRPRPLVKFSVSPKKRATRKKGNGSPKAYKAAVMKRGGLKRMDASKNKPFYAITHNGTDGVFSRKETKIQKQIRITKRLKRRTGVRVYKYRTKVKTGEPYQANILQMHFGPSIPQMAENKEVMSRVQKVANQTLQKRLNHELSRYLERLKQ